jgi:hypothetical protein
MLTSHLNIEMKEARAIAVKSLNCNLLMRTLGDGVRTLTAKSLIRIDARCGSFQSPSLRTSHPSPTVFERHCHGQ